MEQEIFISKENLYSWLACKDKKKLARLYKQADNEAKKLFQNKVYLRGLIEFSNYCQKNCFYCGIRKGNQKIKRYLLLKEEIISSALWAYEQGFGSITLQSGEIETEKRLDFLLDILKTIKKKTKDEIGITISLGELSKEAYKALFQAGADRYLLRIETSNPSLYKSLHPKDHDFEKRVTCLENLKSVGFQTGTGVMIGLPNQTLEDLENDLLFYKTMDMDMIGMGPYLPDKDTPLYKNLSNYDVMKTIELTYKMIALTRLFLKDVNIAATTALETLHPQSRNKALQSGANVVMPYVYLHKDADFYRLYPNQPNYNISKDKYFEKLKEQITKAGKKIAFFEKGHPFHYYLRRRKKR